MRSVLRQVALLRPVASPSSHLYGIRRCATLKSPSAAAAGGVSPVNVEEFTLNMDIVNAHMEAARRWSELSEKMEASRKAKSYDSLVQQAAEGLSLLSELGAENAPIQCEPMLHLEAAQAWYNLGNFAEAKKAAVLARKTTGLEAARLAEIDEFLGFVSVKQANGAEAETIFNSVLKWIDNDAKKAMPMVAVAAVNMRRTVIMGLGMAKELKAQADKQQQMDYRASYDAAISLLIDALNLHIENNDQTAVKETLLTLHRCFLGISDPSQAASTLVKFVNYCERFEDTANVQQGEALLAGVCAAHNLPNALEEGRAAKRAALEREAALKLAKENKAAEEASDSPQ